MRIGQVRCSAMPGMPVSALYTNSYHYHLLLTTYYRSPEKGNSSAAADARDGLAGALWPGQALREEHSRLWVQRAKAWRWE